ncbi:MAG: EF-hand domain-containing protein [Tropicimonas sp.]|uniref:EF-hand domain-containing protein n=1 Tax=Tropicimonas sp. TaxID=2067044 RepID=UPI003A845AE2
MTKSLLIAGLLAASALTAQAQGMVEDTDGDGVYSMEELKAAYADLTDETFAAMDANGDGGVDADELAAAIEAGLVAG